MDTLAQAVTTDSSLWAWPVLLFIGACIALLGRSISRRLRRLPTSFPAQQPTDAGAPVPPAGDRSPG